MILIGAKIRIPTPLTICYQSSTWTIYPKTRLPTSLILHTKTKNNGIVQVNQSQSVLKQEFLPGLPTLTKAIPGPFSPKPAYFTYIAYQNKTQ